jgi:hypothetical protein
MKINQLITIAAPLTLSLVSMTTAIPSKVTPIKRENTPVYLEFQQIDLKFTEFDISLKDKEPDYNHLAYDLNDISTTAEAAWSLLRQSNETQLEDQDAKIIGENLAKIASKSGLVEAMAIKGLDWFKEYKTIDKIAQIIELNVFEFYTLYRELKNHVNQTSYSKFGKDFTTTICEFVTAINVLNPNTPAQNNDAYVYCINYKAGKKGNLATDDFNIGSMTPPGMETCSNQTTRFLDAAYTEHTLGTVVTKCTAKNTGISGPSLPQDALEISLPQTANKAN